MLTLEHISYTVDGKRILDDISFSVDERFVAVTGPNGGGKSTLAKVVMGIVTPDAGRILLDGEDITGLSITERARRGVSFAFQQPIRFKGVTVKDLISLAAGKTISVADACTYLAEVGLCAKDYINREVNASLSGGELKRIEIAMANARATKLTIFDEPEAGIDLWSFNNLIKVFRDMHARTHGTILIISHQERILDIADKVLVIAGGKLVAAGAKNDILPSLLDAQAGCRFTKGDE